MIKKISKEDKHVFAKLDGNKGPQGTPFAYQEHKLVQLIDEVNSLRAAVNSLIAKQK